MNPFAWFFFVAIVFPESFRQKRIIYFLEFFVLDFLKSAGIKSTEIFIEFTNFSNVSIWYYVYYFNFTIFLIIS